MEKSKEFGLRVIATGSIIDTQYDLDRDKPVLYRINTTTVQLNDVAYSEWILLRHRNDKTGLDFDTHEDYIEFLDSKYDEERAFAQRVARCLGIDPKDSSLSVSQSESEIFTVVTIHCIGEANE